MDHYQCGITGAMHEGQGVRNIIIPINPLVRLNIQVQTRPDADFEQWGNRAVCPGEADKLKKQCAAKKSTGKK